MKSLERTWQMMTTALSTTSITFFCYPLCKKGAGIGPSSQSHGNFPMDLAEDWHFRAEVLQDYIGKCRTGLAYANPTLNIHYSPLWNLVTSHMQWEYLSHA